MVHNRYIIISNIMLIILLLIGFTLIELSSVQQYNTIVDQKIESDLYQTALTIESDLENSASVQLAVASYMAKDDTVRHWLENERYASTAAIIHYLAEKSKAFGYDRAFIISEESRDFYYDRGFLRRMNPNDPRDRWYDLFTRSGITSHVLINLDESNDYALSIFTDCRVEDKQGKLLGIIGIGKNLAPLWEIFDEKEKVLGQKIYITPVGEIRTSLNTSIGHYVLHEDLMEKLDIDEDLLENSTTGGTFSTIGNQRIFIKRIERFGWNIIVTQPDVSLIDTLLASFRTNSVYVVMLSVLLVLMSVLGMRRINRKLHQLENIDSQTGIPNQLLFSDQFKALNASEFLNPCSFFTLTVDDLDSISEDLGIAYQNAILNIVSDELMKITDQHGIIGRWERREYIGWLDMSPDNAYKLLLRLNLRLSERDKKIPIQVSIGITNARNNRNLPILAMQAERAMYRSIRNGSGLCTIYDPEIDGIVSIIAAD
ncbi:GGDEF domain-containing protein, diguanylate cyclase (c-di-GMP synthetase) or its enzymatically inactive variants [Lachnospiraceae bacterium]|nr:GGDEF domain-containing protein, diguanylate cyclase (c-di-GMP synthetase) or its enzymatically inactive variants [Lachnospiraceae bacterium]